MKKNISDERSGKFEKNDAQIVQWSWEVGHAVDINLSSALCQLNKGDESDLYTTV